MAEEIFETYMYANHIVSVSETELSTLKNAKACIVAQHLVTSQPHCRCCWRPTYRLFWPCARLFATYSGGADARRLTTAHRIPIKKALSTKCLPSEAIDLVRLQCLNNRLGYFRIHLNPPFRQIPGVLRSNGLARYISEVLEPLGMYRSALIVVKERARSFPNEDNRL